MSDKALVNVMIKNVVNGHRRVSSAVKTEKKPLAYSQPVAPSLKSVPHTPFFSHNDQTKDKKLTDEISDLKKTADKKNQESAQEKQNSIDIVKKDTDELKRIHHKELEEQKDSSKKHYRVLDELKFKSVQKNHHKQLQQQHQSFEESNQKFIQSVQAEKQKQQKKHRVDIIEREMEHIATHRQKDKKNMQMHFV